MLVSFLDIQPQAKFIKSIIKGHQLWKNLCISHLMNVTPHSQRKFQLIIIQEQKKRDEKPQHDESAAEKQSDPCCEIQEEQKREQHNSDQNVGTSQTIYREWTYVFLNLKDLILGDPSHGITTKTSIRNTYEHTALISRIELKSFSVAENDESWIMAMKKVLNQIKRNNV